MMLKDLLRNKIISYYKIINQSDDCDLYSLDLNVLLDKYVSLYKVSSFDFRNYIINYLNISGDVFSWDSEEILTQLYNSEALNPIDITLYFMNYFNNIINEKKEEVEETKDAILNAKNWAQKKDLEDDNHYTNQQIRRFILDLNEIKKIYETYISQINEEVNTRRG